MKVVASIDALRGAVAAAAKIASGRSTIPILGCVLIEASADGTLALNATDMAMWRRQTLPAQVQRKGAVAIHAATLAAIVGSLPEGAQIEIDLRPTLVLVRSGRSSFRLSIHAASDFPRFTDAPEQVTYELGGAELARALRMTAPACGNDPNRSYLWGVHIEPAPEGLVLTACDGSRLHNTVLAAQVASPFAGVILGQDACRVVADLAEGEKTIALRAGENFVEARAGDVLLWMRTIDGTFPGWRHFVPKEDEGFRMALKRQELLAAVKRVLPMAAEDKKSGRYIFLRPQDGSLTVIGGTQFGSDIASDEINAEIAGDDVGDMAFSARYLLDALDAAGGDALTIQAVRGAGGRVRLLGGNAGVFIVAGMNSPVPDQKLRALPEDGA